MSEVLTKVMITMFLWVVTQYGYIDGYRRFGEIYFCPDDEDTMFLRNTDIHLPSTLRHNPEE
jgi:hypothetical protein